MDVRWLSAFLDFSADEHQEGVELWERLTGYARSEPRGEREEFLTLVPPDGDDFLRVQRLADGPSRVHLDVHVEDPRAAAGEASALGATQVADHGYVVMRSPGGLTFCLVDHPASRRPRPTRWPGGHTSLLDQVCLDIPRQHWEREQAFWQRLTGWEHEGRPAPSEFANLRRPTGVPLRLLFQRLGEETGDVRAHLDWATGDRAAETARHQQAGAAVVARMSHWTVMRGPPGTTYCLTDRAPGTGVLEG